MISRAGVSPRSNTDWIIRRSSSATMPRCWARSTTSRSSISDANGPFRKPRPGCQRITQHHQQPADRHQQPRNRLQRKHCRQRDGVGVLTAERAWAHPDDDEAGHHHDGGCAEQSPSQPEVVVEEHDQQDGRRDLAGDPQQHHQVDVARPFRHHLGQRHRAGPLVAHQLLNPGQRHRADGRIDRRE